MAGHARYTALLDACVLYPLAMTDALMSLAGPRRQQVWEAAAWSTPPELLSQAPVQEDFIGLHAGAQLLHFLDQVLVDLQPARGVKDDAVRRRRPRRVESGREINHSTLPEIARDDRRDAFALFSTRRFE